MCLQNLWLILASDSECADCVSNCVFSRCLSLSIMCERRVPRALSVVVVWAKSFVRIISMKVLSAENLTADLLGNRKLYQVLPTTGDVSWRSSSVGRAWTS